MKEQEKAKTAPAGAGRQWRPCGQFLAWSGDLSRAEAVLEGFARLRATVTTPHEADEIRRTIDVIGKADKELGLIT